MAGIVAGEVLTGAFLLLLAGFIHRRYRWRSERSWVLFDWDVVADKAPPKTFSFAGRFGMGNKHVRSYSLVFFAICAKAGIFKQPDGRSKDLWQPFLHPFGWPEAAMSTWLAGATELHFEKSAEE